MRSLLPPPTQLTCGTPTRAESEIDHACSLYARYTIPLLFLIPVLTNTGFAGEAPPSEIDTEIETEHTTQKEYYKAFYNDIDATSFLRLKHGRVYFKIPFPSSEEEFALRIITSEDSNLIFKANYHLENGVATRLPELHEQNNAPLMAEKSTQDEELEEPKPSNSLDFSYNGQLDLSAISSAEDGTDFEDRETNQEGESDLLAGFSAGFNYRSLDTSIDVEGVHRSNDENTVRYEGPRADISQFVSTLRFNAQDGSIFYLKAGDVDVTSNNTLVNSGMSSRGFSFGFVAPDERFQWEVGRVYGQDIIGMVRGPFGYSTNSYRVGASAGLKILSSDQIEWSARLSMLNAKRDTEDAFATGESQSGEENTVHGYGTDLSLFDQTLNLSLSWAKSRYDNPSELNEDNIPDDDEFEIFSPGVTRGDAYKHTIQWDAWRNEEESSRLSLEYASEKSEPFYRSIHGEATADRRQWSLYADLEAGPVIARIGTTQYQNNLDGLISIHTLDEAVHTAEVTLDVVSWRESKVELSGKPAYALPTTVGLRATVEELKTLNGEQIILAPVIEGFDFMNQVTQTLGLSFGWDGESNSTTFDIDYTYFDNSQRERAAADTRDLVYALSHSIYKDNWSLSGRVAFSTNDDLDTVSRSNTRLSEYGLSGSYTSEQGLTLSAGLDRSIDKFNDRVLNENEDTTSVSFSFSLDFGTWLARRLSWKLDPSITANWQRSTTDNRSIYYTNDQVSESFSVNVGVPFE